jgi:hypothetical protein
MFRSQFSILAVIVVSMRKHIAKTFSIRPCAKESNFIFTFFPSYLLMSSFMHLLNLSCRKKREKKYNIGSINFFSLLSLSPTLCLHFDNTRSSHVKNERKSYKRLMSFSLRKLHIMRICEMQISREFN